MTADWRDEAGEMANALVGPFTVFSTRFREVTSPSHTHTRLHND